MLEHIQLGGSSLHIFVCQLKAASKGANAVSQNWGGVRRRFAQQRFEFGEDLLGWVEVERRRRQ